MDLPSSATQFKLRDMKSDSAICRRGRGPRRCGTSIEPDGSSPGNGAVCGLLAGPMAGGIREPVLVASMDGIGTKALIAAEVGRVGWLGHDIVHHCANDVAVHGAIPVLFMDYLAFHHVNAVLAATLVKSMTEACGPLGIALVGGETAEMPAVYQEGRFDVAGAMIGVCERSSIVDGSAMAPGDIVLGFASHGLHTNGFTLVRHLFASEEYDEHAGFLGQTLSDALLAPHRCYLPEIRSLLDAGQVRGLAHVTGGGIAGNLSRVVPPGLCAEVVVPPPPPLYELIHSRGVPIEEMHRVFNMGIGLIAVCDRSLESGLPAGALRLGHIVESRSGGRVRIHDGN